MSFFEELKRRNVVRVGIAYVIAAGVRWQLTVVLMELLDLPDVAGRFVILLLIVGFIPALIFAWAFEMTPEGIKKTAEVDKYCPNGLGALFTFGVKGGYEMGVKVVDSCQMISHVAKSMGELSDRIEGTVKKA